MLPCGHANIAKFQSVFPSNPQHHCPNRWTVSQSLGVHCVLLKNMLLQNLSLWIVRKNLHPIFYPTQLSSYLWWVVLEVMPIQPLGHAVSEPTNDIVLRADPTDSPIWPPLIPPSSTLLLSLVQSLSVVYYGRRSMQPRRIKAGSQACSVCRSNACRSTFRFNWAACWPICM